MNIEKYKEWAAAQICCDCGAKASDKTGLWVTETQCWDCWVKKGAPENRGLPGAKDLANADGINAQRQSLGAERRRREVPLERRVRRWEIDMDYEQRFSAASSHYQQALRRVAETPPPTGQKFAPGTRVKIADNLGRHMSHFPGAGKLATVQYTYAHAYEVTDQRSMQQYSLDIDGIGGVSWYDECQLSAVPNA